MKRRSIWLVTAMLMLVLAGCHADKFELKGSEPKKQILVKGPTKAFELDIATGDKTKYDIGLPKNFTLTVGGCLVKIDAYLFRNPTVLRFDSNGTWVESPRTLKVNSQGIEIEGVNSATSLSSTCSPPVNFASVGGDFSVWIEFGGNVSSDLKISSSTLDVYDPSGDGKGGNEDPKQSNTGLIVGIVVGIIVFILVAVGGAVAFIMYRKRRMAELEESDIKTDADDKSKDQKSAFKTVNNDQTNVTKDVTKDAGSKKQQESSQRGDSKPKKGKA